MLQLNRCKKMSNTYLYEEFKFWTRGKPKRISMSMYGYSRRRSHTEIYDPETTSWCSQCSYAYTSLGQPSIGTISHAHGMFDSYRKLTKVIIATFEGRSLPPKYNLMQCSSILLSLPNIDINSAIPHYVLGLTGIKYFRTRR